MEERLRDPSVSVITWQIILVTELFSVEVDLIQLRILQPLLQGRQKAK